jgi:hypothetical protein
LLVTVVDCRVTPLEGGYISFRLDSSAASRNESRLILAIPPRRDTFTLVDGDDDKVHTVWDRPIKAIFTYHGELREIVFPDPKTLSFPAKWNLWPVLRALLGDGPARDLYNGITPDYIEIDQQLQDVWKRLVCNHVTWSDTFDKLVPQQSGILPDQ